MMPTHINGRYEVIRELGEGGMGTVYLAYDPNTNRQVAVKVLLPVLLVDKSFIKRFEREINIAASLQHPAIVPVYDSGQEKDNGRAFIVMPVMEGGSLKDLLSQGPLASERIAAILATLAAALDEVHEERIIHRDLKPSNILFNKRNNPCIADFGLARHFEGTQVTGSGSLLGSFAYMSPEQASDPSNLDGRSDIYSLGGILFKMLTGKDPYHHIEHGLALLFHHANTPPPRLDELRPDLSSDWQDIINKAMAKTPQERYSTAKELSDAVQDLVYRPQPQPVVEPQPQPQPQPVVEPNKLAWVIFGLFAVLLLGIVIFLMFPPEPDREAPTVTVQPSAAPTTRGSSKDGMVEVYVPAGAFMMGSLDNDEDNDNQEAFPAEKPQRAVYLDAYWIDQNEVTNGMYQQCVETGACVPPSPPETGENRYGNPELINHPVTNVSWEEASAYCLWAERRLPTEAEWEKAARGIDSRLYPWGNQELAGHFANFCDGSCESESPDSAQIDDGYAETAPVGSYSAGMSPYGALDMAGNVSEWVADWYDESYYQNAPERNPPGPSTGSGSGTQRVLRGGSWRNEARLLRTAYRSQKPPTSRNPYSGIRCANTP